MDRFQCLAHVAVDQPVAWLADLAIRDLHRQRVIEGVAQAVDRRDQVSRLQFVKRIVYLAFGQPRGAHN